MAFALTTQLDLAGSRGAEQVRQAIVLGRRAYYEDPAGVLAEAIRCHEIARFFDDAALCARARALQGAVSLHRGDLRGSLAVEAERYSERSEDIEARAEVAALKAQLNFFTGSYSEALSHAELAVQLADQAQDPALRIYARRATCLVFGNVGVPDLAERIAELLRLTIESGDRGARGGPQHRRSK